MKNDLNDLKKLTRELMENNEMVDFQKDNEGLIQKIYSDKEENIAYPVIDIKNKENSQVEILKDDKFQYVQDLETTETLSLHDKELELIKKSLEKHAGKRKLAAKELGISERTLYRKIKQFDL